MARILVQTNDYHTVLDEPNVQLQDISDQKLANGLLGRLGQAVQAADAAPEASRRIVKHVAAIVPASDYRSVAG